MARVTKRMTAAQRRRVLPRAAARPRALGTELPAAAFEASPAAMLVLDDERRCLAANAAACALLGVERVRLTTRAADGAPLFASLERALAPRWRCLLATGGGAGDVELPGERAHWQLAPAIAPGHNLLTLRVAEDGALVSRLRRQLVEAQSVGGFGHWEWDIPSGRVQWNDELHRICHLEPGAVTSVDDVHELVHPDEREARGASLADARAHRDRFSQEFRVACPDGVTRVLESRGEIVRGPDGTPARMFGTAQDITHRAHAEAERRNFSSVLDGSDDAISACSIDGMLVSWNRGAEKLYGYSAEEAIGQRVTMLLPPEEHSRAFSKWQRCLQGEHIEPFESERITKDGRRLVIAVTLSPIANATGEIIGVAAVGRDMTEQKRTQAELATAHARAVEASRLKSEFMANMNHELRTPLNGVIGVSGLLLETALDDEQREYVKALRVSGSALMAVIEDILDFSKIEAGKLVIETEPFELGTLVEDVCAMVAVGRPASEVELIASIPPDAPVVITGDAKRLRQVLTNLTNNAFKFTERGEVAVSVAVASAEPAILRFEVADTGIGIERDVQQSIFESFCQADGSTTRRFGGTGLGLTIAKQLVELMGGQIGVTSTPGAGSTFHFTLPTTVVAPASGERVSGARVLVVDGRALNRAILEDRLRAWGMRVHARADLDEALADLRTAAAAGAPYELVLVDYPLWAADGDRALARAAGDARLLAMVAPHDAHAASIATGLHAIVAKPIRLAHLREELVRAAAPLASCASAAPPGGAPAVPATPPDGAPRVLLAEDNPVNQLVAARLLEQRGLAVDVAADGREVLERCVSTRYDAIFMDCQMPEIDGYEATRELRRRERAGERTPIIAMTASTLPGDTERCLAAGMDHYTAKPVDAAHLDMVLALVLGERLHPAATR